MKFLLLALPLALTVVACSGKKRVPFNHKAIDYRVDVDTKITEAQEKIDRALESLKEEGILCEIISREERKEIFLVPKKDKDESSITYNFNEIIDNSKSFSAVIDGFKILTLSGRSMLNKDGSTATAVKGHVFSAESEVASLDPSYIAHFVIEDSQDRGIQVTAVLETMTLKGESTTRELARIEGCVKTKL